MSVDRIRTIVETIDDGASFASDALPYIKFAASLFPWGRQILSVVEAVGPIVDRVRATAPVAISLINSGEAIYDALNKSGPSMVADLKEIYAIWSNKNPNVARFNMSASEVTNAQAVEIAGPILLGRRWTQEEEQRWFDKATGDISA